MTTFKLPAYLNASYEGDGLFTETQLKHAIRDVLEQAACKCEEIYESRGAADECATEIRAMIKEIPE